MVPEIEVQGAGKRRTNAAAMEVVTSGKNLAAISHLYRTLSQEDRSKLIGVTR